MILKCADVGHLSKSEAVHRRWVEGLEEELFRQGDEEKKLGMAISPLMNRMEGGITSSQVGSNPKIGAQHGKNPLLSCMYLQYAYTLGKGYRT